MSLSLCMVSSLEKNRPILTMLGSACMGHQHGQDGCCAIFSLTVWYMVISRCNFLEHSSNCGQRVFLTPPMTDWELKAGQLVRVHFLIMELRLLKIISAQQCLSYISRLSTSFTEISVKVMLRAHRQFFHGYYTGQPVLRTGGFCCSKVLLPTCPYWWRLVYLD